jgi:glycerol-3-phosphate dehydrogenase
VDGVANLIKSLKSSYPFLDDPWAQRLIRAYGTEAKIILGDAKITDDLGADFGATLTEVEVVWLMDREYARRAEDVVWRRNKLGLRMTDQQIAMLDLWMVARHQAA